MIYLLIFIFVIIVVLLANKRKTTNKSIPKKSIESPVLDVGMYFMNLHQALEKDRSEIPNKILLLDYYWTLGCASQGRIIEVKSMIKESKNTPLELVFNQYSPQILKMARIAKEVDDKPIGYDIGEYFDRKVSKRPAYMSEFNFFKTLNVSELINSNHSI
jgi:hypothetical protein